MYSCPMYNGQNLVFTGKSNPYGLIQMAGKRGSRRKTMRKEEKSVKQEKISR